MELYRNGDVTVSLIEEMDIDTVLHLFDINSFGYKCYETDALRPTRTQFYKIIKENMETLNKTDCVFVLRKNNVCIGYISCFVEYDKLVMGHIAVKKEEQHKGYGKLLTSVAMQVASKENRDVSCICYHYRNYLQKLGFKRIDDVTYIYEGRVDCKDIKSVFVSLDEYKVIQDNKMAEEIKSYKNFLKSDLAKKIYFLK